MKRILKRIAKFLYYFPSNFFNKIRYRFKRVKVGKGHETKGQLYIRNKGIIRIGDNVRINSSGKANPIGMGERTCFQVLPNGKLLIGNHTRMSNCAFTAATEITVGNFVRIGAGAKFYDTDFHSLDPCERTSSPEGKAVSKPITIKDYAFIGAGALILKGVTVGEAAVIGAGAVVTKNVPDREIWGGNPAKKIGEVPAGTSMKNGETFSV